MRVSRIIGILLIALGAVVLIGGGSFATRRNMLHVGNVTVTANERRGVPPWVAGLAMVLGVVLVVSGRRPRTA